MHLLQRDKGSAEEAGTAQAHTPKRLRKKQGPKQEQQQQKVARLA